MCVCDLKIYSNTNNIFIFDILYFDIIKVLLTFVLLIYYDLSVFNLISRKTYYGEIENKIISRNSARIIARKSYFHRHNYQKESYITII